MADFVWKLCFSPGMLSRLFLRDQRVLFVEPVDNSPSLGTELVPQVPDLSQQTKRCASRGDVSTVREALYLHEVVTFA